MGKFYIDESIHDDAGFIVASCVYTDTDPSEKINEIIRTNDFDPQNFEFKSSINYSRYPKKVKIREDFNGFYDF